MKLFSEFRKKNNFKKTEEIIKEFNKLISMLSDKSRTFSYQTHPQAIYTSRLLDYKNLPEPQNSKEINKQFWSMHGSKDFYLNIDSLELQLKKTSLEEQYLNKKPEKTDWQNVNPSFTNDLIQSWTNHHFTPQETQDWINIGLTPNDFSLAAWLRDTKQTDAEWVINHSNLEQLRNEYHTQWQIQQEQSPK